MIMTKIKEILYITYKELCRIISDSGTVLILLIAPVLYAFIYSIPYSTEVVNKIDIGFCDNDNSALSREYKRMIDASPYFNIKSCPESIESAKDELFQRKIYGFILIPKDFARDIQRNTQTAVSLYTDSTYMIVYKELFKNTNLITTTFSKQLEIKNIIKEKKNAKEAISTSLSFEMADMPLFNTSGGYEGYIFPVILVLILQQTMLVGVGLLTGTEREQGFFRQLKPKDITKNILGRSLAYVFLYSFHSILYFLVMPRLYGYSIYYNFFLLLFLLIPYLFSISFLAQALTILYKSRESAFLTIVVLSLPFVFLPGIIWPTQSIPAIIRYISNLLPSTPGVDGIIKVKQMSAQFVDVWQNALILFALCLLYYFLATLVYNKLIKDNQKD